MNNITPSEKEHLVHTILGIKALINNELDGASMEIFKTRRKHDNKEVFLLVALSDEGNFCSPIAELVNIKGMQELCEGYKDYYYSPNEMTALMKAENGSSSEAANITEVE